ncbi:MAG: TolC family protein [Candidatus Latescibacterota bacterium]
MRRFGLFWGFMAVLLWAGDSFAQGTKELTLEESVRIALDKSKVLAMARERAEESEAKIGEARAGFLPQIGSSASYTRLDVVPYVSTKSFAMPGTPPGTFPDKIETGDDDLYHIAVSARQPLFTGFRTVDGYHIARYGAETERLNYLRSESDLVLQVAEAYWGVLKAQEFGKVAEQSVAQMDAHVRDLENMYEVGMIAENDLLKAKVQRSNIGLMRIQATNAARMARTSLCSVLGIPLDTELILKAKLVYEPSAPVALDEAIQEALEKRPEVEAMAYSMKIGQRSVSLSKAGCLPNIVLMGNYNFKRPDRENETKWYGSWDATLAAEMNLFDWGATHYRTAQAKHRLRQLEAGASELRDAITLQVTQSYLARQEAREKVAATRENGTQVEENYRITHEKFKQGMATNTDLLDAGTMWTQAKMEAVQALADLSVAEAQLAHAIGAPHER